MSTKQITYVKLSLYFWYHTENLDDTFWNPTDANIEKKNRTTRTKTYIVMHLPTNGYNKELRAN